MPKNVTTNAKQYKTVDTLMTKAIRRYCIKLLPHFTVIMFLLTLSLKSFAQEPYAEYRFKILKGIDKEEITPIDTSYKIEIIRTEKNKTQNLYYAFLDSSQHYWDINEAKSKSQSFNDFIRIRITHEIDTMNIILAYDANIWGGKYSQIKMDTILFTRGNFERPNRIDFNYWKNLEYLRVKPIEYEGEKYYFTGFYLISFKLIDNYSVLYRYDSLRLFMYQHYPSPPYYVYVNNKGVVVIKKNNSKCYYYDNDGKLILKKIGFLPTSLEIRQDTIKPLNYKGKKYYCNGREGGLKAMKNISTVLFSYDTLDVYSYNKNDIRHYIYLNSKGIVVIKGQRKHLFWFDNTDYTKQRKPLDSFPMIGTWKYYNNEGKLILKRKYKLPKKKKNERVTK